MDTLPTKSRAAATDDRGQAIDLSDVWPAGLYRLLETAQDNHRYFYGALARIRFTNDHSLKKHYNEERLYWQARVNSLLVELRNRR